ncbi:MAG: DUF2339 domain-containing protein, partial [Thermoleophilia bacterium]|nr:DUF2339 domain-containing protein [Thermoleophilia bacterium]
MEDENTIDERLGKIEEDLDDIRLALWMISEKMEEPHHEPADEAKSGVELSQNSEAGQAGETEPVHEVTPATPTEVAAAVPHTPATAPHAQSTAPQNPAAAPRAPAAKVHKPAAVKKKKPAAPRFVGSAQFWFNLIGIVLVLLGVIFLYRYSVDQGWITPPMRVAAGMALGVALVGLGLFLHVRQRFFSQMLMGGGIAALYISGFAAFQLYELIPYPVAIAWMGSVTLVAFVLSVQQDEQVLSLVATIGGLVTPFMLTEAAGSRADVIIYACAVLSGSSAVYLYKGWRPLLWISVAGGWLTLIFIYVQSMPGYRGLTATDKRAMQFGVVFAVLAFWLLPLLREALSARNPDRWPRPHLISERDEFDTVESVINRHVHTLSISTPFIALFFTREIWDLTNREWGWVTLGAAAICGLAFLALRSQEQLRELAYTQALVDLTLTTMAIGLILDGDARFIALAAEATALQLVAWRLKDRVVLIIAHGYFLLMSLWLLERLLENEVQGRVVLNTQALSELGFIIAAGGVSWLLSPKAIRYTYQLGAYVALLGWFLRELSELPNGQAYVTVAWGVSAIALLAAG